MKKKKRPLSSSKFNRQTFYYLGMGTQMLVSIGIAVFAGLKADAWLHTSPLLTCAFPLLVLVVIFYKLLKQTQQPDDNKNDDRLQ